MNDGHHVGVPVDALDLLCVISPPPHQSKKLLASVGNLGSGAIVNNAALQLNQATDATLEQAISGCLTKTGAGALTLTGNGSNFAGTTQIEAGSLLLSSTGTVGGTGTVTTVKNGATLAAGAETVVSWICNSRH